MLGDNISHELFAALLDEGLRDPEFQHTWEELILDEDAEDQNKIFHPEEYPF